MTGVEGWERKEEKEGGCSFRNSSNGARFRMREDLSPGEGTGGAGREGANDDVEPLMDAPQAPNPTGVTGDNKLVDEMPLVTPPLPKLLKERSFGRGDGVGAPLGGPSAVGVLAVGLAMGVPQNSWPNRARDANSCRDFAS